MNKFSQALLKTANTFTATELSGASRIQEYFYKDNKTLLEITVPSSVEHIGHGSFYNCINLGKLNFQEPYNISEICSSSFECCTNLLSVYIPYSVVEIGNEAFSGCSNLTNVNSDDMNPYCVIGYNVFESTPWLEQQTGMVVIAKGKILIKSDGVTGQLPNTIINLAGYSCDGLVTNSSLVIPDTIEVVATDLTTVSITKLTIGTSINNIPTSFIDSSITTLICRQPSGMYITLPQAGDGTGIAYNKNSREVSIYTDNEYIRNYAWSTDNVTATFYPLSQAPM